MKSIMHISLNLQSCKTKANYFSSVEEAIGAVKMNHIDKVELRFHEGQHICNIEVDFPLSIVGVKGKKTDTILKGSIINRHGNNLKIKNITISNSKNFGILQIGGTLDVQNVVFNGFKRSKLSKVQGFRTAALSLSMGARLKATDIFFNLNNLPAIFIEGINTKATFSNLNICDTLISQFSIQNPPTLTGAIEVTNYGTLLIENSLIENNEYIGISVHDNGKMHLRDTLVKGTKKVQDGNGGYIFGDNIFISSGGTVELHRFSSDYAQRVGITIDNGFLTAENGTVNYNLIGIAFLSNPIEPNYNPFNCIYDDVKFVGNSTKISGALPIPLITPPDRSLCKIITWS
jgi:hypothetical protein